MEKIEWVTPEYIHTDKNNDWYWIVGIISITIALISIILNNIIFAILILVSGFTLSLFSSRKPEFINIKIDDKGIDRDKVFHPYDEISSYYIETKDAFPRIILKLKKYLSPTIKILIDIEKIEEIENILSNHLDYEDLSESLFEKILIRLGV